MKPRRYSPLTLVRAILLGMLILFSHTVIAQDDEDYSFDDLPEHEAIFERHRGEPPSLNKRNFNDDQVNNWKADDDFWYADQDLKKKPEKKKSGSYTPVAKRLWFQTILWILIIGGFVGVLFWFLTENRVGLFSRKQAPLPAIGEEDIPEDIFAINYQKEIDNALRDENYRLAVRLMFLRLLKTLSERNVIRYKQEKTNLDYLFETQPTAYYNNFFRVVRNYDYSWYGQFPVSREAYDIIKKDFDSLDKQLQRP